MKLFITGGTGFLGISLVKELASDAEKIYLLVRKRSFIKASKTFKNFNNVEVVIGDITQPNILIDEKIKTEICSNVDSIFHIAGLYNPEASYSDCLIYNVAGTQNMLSFSSLFKNLKVFHYMSTIAVCGNYQGILKEAELDVGQSFNNHYEKTKFDAELIVRSWNFPKQVFTRIYRPGILIGVGGARKRSTQL